MVLGMLPLMAAAQSGHFNVDASLSGVSKPTKAFLTYTIANKSRVDSAVSENGSWHFQGELVEPAAAKLLIDHAGVGMRRGAANPDVLPLYLENGKVIIKGRDSIKTANINGSRLNDEFIAYNKQIDRSTQDTEKARAKLFAATPEQKKDEKFNEEIEREYSAAGVQRQSQQKQFIKTHPASFISLVAIQDISNAQTDVAVIEPLYNNLSKQIKETPSGIDMAKEIALQKTVAVGMTAPLFTQNDVEGKPVSLADFKGKYVLVDFWASWCVPCRAENPNVVKAYHQYKDKNFTIIGVSMDAAFTKNAWIAAIKADGLEWTQVSDLKFADNAVAKQYGIKSIPQNVLIDPNGKIVGKNLRGKALNNKLKELLGS